MSKMVPFSFTYDGQSSEEFIDEWGYRGEAWCDPVTGLEVRIDAVYYDDAQAEEWTLHFTNRGDADTPVIADIMAFDGVVAFDVTGPLTLHHSTGSQYRADDWVPVADDIGPGQYRELWPVGGRSSNGQSPFFNLEWPGGGVIVAVGWSGNWSASIERLGDEVELKVGLRDIATILHPGESIRSPRVLTMYWDGDIEDSYNRFRQLMLDHILPRVGDEVITPPIATVANSCYIDNEITEAYVLDHLASDARAGFEVFWVDAFYTRGGFPDGMGNYSLPVETSVDLERFPGGMQVIGQAAREAGMQFMMWTEPERVAPGTRIATEHPEWVLWGGRNNCGILDLGNPEARAYITAYLSAVVEQYGLGWLRFDFNIDPALCWFRADAPDRIGWHENQYIQGLYRMWDELRERHPGLKLDNCASGGRRIDLETCARATPLWRSDLPGQLCHEFHLQEAAVLNQAITAGLSRFVPYSCSGVRGHTPYLLRSGVCAGISYNEDTRGVGYPLETLQAGIAEIQRTRKYYAGNLYCLNAVTISPEDWSVRQYHLPAEGAGIIVAFRRHESPYESFRCKLREIDPAAAYWVTWAFDFEPYDEMDLPGDVLQQLVIDIGDCPGSVLIEYGAYRTSDS